ncbi:hypothetical protein GCM10010082_05820 [Kushneria pakistanensis]|uniref:HTH cro/C1-type domain-containing protein n=1 Tax=Kushneria pakistanensis TaxID=1508770 RepID=A0ABQ3FBU1_9GAMM|nr:XRE family transcriptional regulator [Kushneria pakistanensis]GHC17469.1 hypothetical protein GCM10010082_05820 [Kushneria pakistanensis]
MTTIGHRLKTERERIGLSQTAFANLGGVGKSTQINYEKDGRAPTADYLVALEKAGVDIYYVLTGRSFSTDMDEQPTATSSAIPLDGCSRIPIYDIEAAAGSGRLFDAERIDRYIPLDSQWLSEHGVDVQHVVALTAVGDSMADTVNEGDVILVDRSRTKPDGVFLVRVGDALRIKRVQRMAGGALSLVSDNRKYEPELITPEMLGRGEVEVIGQVFGHLGRVS